MILKSSLHEDFSLPLLNWFDKYGRKNLPWQHPRSPYRVWVSEIMLQQTQVQTVIPYFERFIATFSELVHLAEAAEDQVLAHWSGLGYYSRARNLHKTAKIIHENYNDRFPSDVALLTDLPGIGPSTAAAIASQAFGLPCAILDANVKRVLSRYFMPEGLPGSSNAVKKLWQYAQACMPTTNCADYTQAIMDLGATCCRNKNPDCQSCPLQKTCLAFSNNEVNNYPVKKIKKVRPLKEQQFILFYNEDKQIYLEKRPPTGIWGGLWCLPSLEKNQQPKAGTHEFPTFDFQDRKAIMDLKHSFSHFRLHIEAIAVKAAPSSDVVRETKGKWFSVEELPNVGLARPVQTIISCFLSNFK